jgi:hypothetical protein
MQTPDRWFLDALETAVRRALPSAAKEGTRYGARQHPLSVTIAMADVRAWLDGDATVVGRIAGLIAVEIRDLHARRYIRLDCRLEAPAPDAERRFRFWVTANVAE